MEGPASCEVTVQDSQGRTLGCVHFLPYSPFRCELCSLSVKCVHRVKLKSIVRGIDQLLLLIANDVRLYNNHFIVALNFKQHCGMFCHTIIKPTSCVQQKMLIFSYTISMTELFKEHNFCGYSIVV